MTSHIKYRTIWCPLIYSRLPLPIAQLRTFWNIQLIPCLWHTASSYGITAGMKWRRKSSIPVFYAHWFIRDSHPHSTTAHILKYTIEIVSASHPACKLWTSTQQGNGMDVENQVSHYLMPTDLFQTPTPIAQLRTFWNIRLKQCLWHTACKLWHHSRHEMT